MGEYLSISPKLMASSIPGMALARSARPSSPPMLLSTFKRASESTVGSTSCTTQQKGGLVHKEPQTADHIKKVAHSGRVPLLIPQHCHALLTALQNERGGEGFFETPQKTSGGKRRGEQVSKPRWPRKAEEEPADNFHKHPRPGYPRVRLKLTCNTQRGISLEATPFNAFQNSTWKQPGSRGDGTIYEGPQKESQGSGETVPWRRDW